MSQILDREQFFKIEIEKLRNSTRDINFDVFLQLSENNFAHVFSRTTGMDYRRLAQYIQKGVKELYVRIEDREEFEKFVANSVDQILDDPGVQLERKVAVLLNMTEQNMSELFVQLNIPEETAEMPSA